MTKEELAKISVEEFSRLQKWMLSVDKDSEAYRLMFESNFSRCKCEFNRTG